MATRSFVDVFFELYESCRQKFYKTLIKLVLLFPRFNVYEATPGISR